MAVHMKYTHTDTQATHGAQTTIVIHMHVLGSHQQLNTNARDASTSHWVHTSDQLQTVSACQSMRICKVFAYAVAYAERTQTLRTIHARTPQTKIKYA